MPLKNYIPETRILSWVKPLSLHSVVFTDKSELTYTLGDKLGVAIYCIPKWCLTMLKGKYYGVNDMEDLFSNLVQTKIFLPLINKSLKKKKKNFTPKNDDSSKEIGTSRCQACKNTDSKNIYIIGWWIIVMKYFD